MELDRSKGQIFVIGAILFTSLIIILFLTTAELPPESDTGETKHLFENSMQKAPEKLNQAIKQNKSIETVSEHLYSLNRFIERSSISKGTEYGSSQLAVLPQEGKTVFINYRNSNEDLRLKINDDWHNVTVLPKQQFTEGFDPGKTEFRIYLPEKGIDQKFTASSPRLFNMMKMSSQNQIWINSEIS